MSLRQFCTRLWTPSRGFNLVNRLRQVAPDQGRVPIPEQLRDQVQKSHVRIDIPSTVLMEQLRDWELERTRVVPTLKTFYGGNPVHEEYCNQLNALIRKYCDLPIRAADDESTYKFIGFESYKKMANSGSRVKETHHSELTALLHRLRMIDSQMMPQEVKDVLEKFSVKTNIFKQVDDIERTLDTHGRAFAVGKRKLATAEVWLVRGEGQTLVNGKSIVEYFPLVADRKRIVYPFQVVTQEGNYNIFAKVRGGGTSAQADAVMYGISKALTIFNPLLKPRLRKAGLMTRDARTVERKKPGRVKARKMPTWVKR